MQNNHQLLSHLIRKARKLFNHIANLVECPRGRYISCAETDYGRKSFIGLFIKHHYSTAQLLSEAPYLATAITRSGYHPVMRQTAMPPLLNQNSDLMNHLSFSHEPSNRNRRAAHQSWPMKMALGMLSVSMRSLKSVAIVFQLYTERELGGQRGAS